MNYASDIAFTDTVKAIQESKGSRDAYARVEQSHGWETQITTEAKVFIESQTSVFLATANAAGQPYVQHRGGPAGFLRVLDRETIGFVDYSGNQQFISLGNLAENPQAYLFLIDYSQRRRIKIWGEASVVENDPALLAQLMPAHYKARPAQVILFKVKAWDANCPQHIPRRYEAADVERALAERDQRIAELEAQVRALQAARE
ncbi:putative pyridoxine 5'-phosphate oxidase superfamily flavin-nucleotide-binding protein [Oxalobacteraceae bacterium GrIS 2.11]